MALLGMLMTSDQPEASAPAPAPEFLSNTAFQALTPTNARAFTGSAGDSFIGYTAATAATEAQDALIDAGKGIATYATFDMSAGGNNLLLAADSAAASGSLDYTGGSGDDSLTFGDNLAYDTYGDATFDMSEGGNNTFVAGTNAAYIGSLAYTGGSGVDSLTFGDNLAYHTDGDATLDLGVDTVADTVTFQGSVGGGNVTAGGSVTIKNFNFNHDTIDVAAGVSATTAEIADASGDLTWTDSGGNHTIVFEEIGTGGTGVVATSAQLAADII
ncbi:MAG: hypothetical protein CME02_08035 [Geminicoccus sp.]|nr:hypothetical protein [Geminicoccus sp.]